jgi:hypothetical protein
MKYLVINEWSPEDWNTAIKRDAIIQADRERFPRKYPKKPIETCFLSTELPKLTETFRTVDVYDVDDPEQLTNLAAFWDAQKVDLKSFKRWYIPLFEYREPYSTELHRQLERVEKMREESKTIR